MLRRHLLPPKLQSSPVIPGFSLDLDYIVYYLAVSCTLLRLYNVAPSRVFVFASVFTYGHPTFLASPGLFLYMPASRPARS